MQAMLDWVVGLGLWGWAALFGALAVYSGLLAFWVGAKTQDKSKQGSKYDA